MWSGYECEGLDDIPSRVNLGRFVAELLRPTSAKGRGCVKTQEKFLWQKIDLSGCAMFNSFQKRMVGSPPKLGWLSVFTQPRPKAEVQIY